eukprot:233499-Chlamydomonas_euryale.AAC.4
MPHAGCILRVHACPCVHATGEKCGCRWRAHHTLRTTSHSRQSHTCTCKLVMATHHMQGGWRAAAAGEQSLASPADSTHAGDAWMVVCIRILSGPVVPPAQSPPRGRCSGAVPVPAAPACCAARTPPRCRSS